MEGNGEGMIEPGGGTFGGLPREVLDRARDDPEWAARVLHVDTRKDALAEIDIRPDYDLDARLDEVANMSMREALTKVRGEQQLQP